MVSTLILGAGSIGNHMSYACRCQGWTVAVYDNDPVALKRMKNDIYPSRYKIWDEQIELLDAMPKNRNFDVVIVGTPPETHITLATMAIDEFAPRLVLVEKPLCPPGSDELEDFLKLVEKRNVRCLVGFNHNLAKSMKYVEKCLRKIKPSEVISIEISWLESWSGIFAAHPWLDGPSDSYLGFTKRGGGACHEHSHAVALGIHISNLLELGEVRLIGSSTDIKRDNNTEYDATTSMTLATDSGVEIHIKQDVITHPAIKQMKIKFHDGELLWSATDKTGGDLVKFKDVEKFFPKTRAQDFQPEIEHVNDILSGGGVTSPIDLKEMVKVSELSSKCFER